jgi:hypothetical protein
LWSSFFDSSTSHDHSAQWKHLDLARGLFRNSTGIGTAWPCRNNYTAAAMSQSANSGQRTTSGLALWSCTNFSGASSWPISLPNSANGMSALATPGGDHGGRGRCSTPILCERRVAPVRGRTPRCGKRRHVPRTKVITGRCWHGIGSSRLPTNVSIWLENFHRMTIDGEQVEG